MARLTSCAVDTATLWGNVGRFEAKKRRKQCSYAVPPTPSSSGMGLPVPIVEWPHHRVYTRI